MKKFRTWSRQTIELTSIIKFSPLGRQKMQSIQKAYLLPSTVHPLLVLPGILGTWPPYSAPRGKLDPLTQAYENLINGLQTIGYQPGVTLFPFPYDWRLPVDQIAQKLQAEITRIKNLPAAPGVDYSKVDLVCHSLGGLVARAYIQGDNYGQDVRRLLMVATPHRGALAAYPAYEAGDSAWIGVPKSIARILANMVKIDEAGSLRRSALLVYKTVRGRHILDLQHYMQSELHTIKDLLPLGQQKYLYKIDEDGQEKVYPFGHPENPFLEKLNQSANLEKLKLVEEIICLYSGSEKTPVRFKVAEPVNPPIYEHGQPLDKQPAENYQAGDGIVPVFSARLDLINPALKIITEDLTQTSISNLNHVQIVGDPAPVRRILDYFVRPEIGTVNETIFDGPLYNSRKTNVVSFISGGRF